MLLQGEEIPNHQTMTTFPLCPFVFLPFVPWTVGDYSFVRHGLFATHGNSSLAAQPPSLINRIPIEVLGEIFNQCLKNPDVSMEYMRERRVTNSPSSSIDPMTLAQVCQHWRVVALSMPVLWSSIYITSPCWGHLRLTRVWLDRSGTCPLDIQLVQQQRSGLIMDHAVTHELITLLITQIHRWRSISFHLWERIPSSLSQISHNFLTQLESVTVLVSMKQPSENAHLDNMWRAAHAAPTLREVHWDRDYLATMPSHIPWNQLTVVCLHAILPMPSLMNILHSCQNVVNLDVHIHEISPIPPTPATLPHLRRLSIWSGCPFNLFLDHLTLPQISSLDLIRSYDPIIPEECTSLNNLLTRSDRYLSNLLFSDEQHKDNGGSIVAFLGLPRMSSLKDLEILSPAGEQVMHALTCESEPSHEVLLPRLEKLCLARCHTTPDILSNMVLSRKVAADGKVSRLRYLEIMTWKPRSSIGELAIFRELAGNGLDIKLYDA
ncbi:hypothetical protein Hypma_005017 [Hypsizygus marmoreus]|uniref:Uncharacterized protein n=1 Tax=Hypsizygus marmoreus TaxID=39966 RepID=A0A369K362_HYPMA|nr:hypothetical protein Hypma_005017 [Hypsizygus marmoreus]